MIDKKKPKKEKARERPKEGFVRESSGIYISDDELISLIEEMVPRIIRDKPYLKNRFRELFSDVFVEKRDIDKVLEEMRMEREEDRKRWEEANKRFEAITLEIKQLREDTNKRFEILTLEMKQMREDTNKRFEAVDRRFEALTLEIKQLREDTNKRFEILTLEMKQMREDTNKRFEAVDRRFEALTLEIKQLREDTNKRFEILTLEMKQMREDTNKRFEAVDRRFEEMFDELKRMREDLHRSISTIGSRWGVAAENTFRNALKEVLTDMGLTVEKWRRIDEEGRIFDYPTQVEIDIVIKDGKTYAIEIKSSLSKAEVDIFNKCVRFYEVVDGRKVDEKIILAVYAPEKSLEYAKKCGIKVISEAEEIKEVI